MTFTLTTAEQAAFTKMGIVATDFFDSRVEEIVNQAKEKSVLTRAADIALLKTEDIEEIDAKIAAAKEDKADGGAIEGVIA